MKKNLLTFWAAALAVVALGVPARAGFGRSATLDGAAAMSADRSGDYGRDYDGSRVSAVSAATRASSLGLSKSLLGKSTISGKKAGVGGVASGNGWSRTKERAGRFIDSDAGQFALGALALGFLGTGLMFAMMFNVFALIPMALAWGTAKIAGFV